jgi:hypothetical protein
MTDTRAIAAGAQELQVVGYDLEKGCNRSGILSVLPVLPGRACACSSASAVTA